MSVNRKPPVTRAPIHVQYVCACNHPAADHDGENGECQNIVDINDLGATICACPRYAAHQAAPTEPDAPHAGEGE